MGVLGVLGVVAAELAGAGLRSASSQRRAMTNGPARCRRSACSVRGIWLGMGEVVGELRGRGVARFRADRQAAQDDFLQPGRQVRPERARRQRVDVEPPPHGAARGRRTERPVARRQPIGDDAEGEDVAARVVAPALQLLGSNALAAAGRQPVRLLDQIGQFGVAGDAEIDQHCRAVGAKQDVAGLEVEVHDILPVQVVHGGGDGADQAGDFRRIERRARHGIAQPAVLDALHDQPGRAVLVAAGDEAWHMRALQAAEDHLLHLEADEAAGVAAEAELGNFHQQREGGGEAGASLAPAASTS